MKAATNSEDIKNLEIHLLKRNPRGLEILYELYAPVLYGIALKISSQESFAEELVRDTLLRFFNNFTEKTCNGQTIQLYLVNDLRSVALKKTSLTQNQRNFFSVGKPVEDKNPLFFKISGKPSAQTVTINVLDLVFFSGKNLNEIARQLGIEKDKVKSLLREELKNYKRTPRIESAK